MPRMSAENRAVVLAAFDSLLQDNPEDWDKVEQLPKEDRLNLMATAAAVEDLMRLSLGLPMRMDPAMMAALMGAVSKGRKGRGS